MNAITELFVEHLRRSPALDAVEEWVSSLEACDEAPEGTKEASFRYMAAVQKELLAFMGTVDLVAAAVKLQE